MCKLYVGAHLPAVKVINAQREGSRGHCNSLAVWADSQCCDRFCVLCWQSEGMQKLELGWERTEARRVVVGNNSVRTRVGVLHRLAGPHEQEIVACKTPCVAVPTLWQTRRHIVCRLHSRPLES